MSFPRYPEYKDSGDAALGQIPSHWRVARIGDVAKVVNGYPFDSALFHDDGAYPLIRIRDLGVSETATRYSGDFVETAAVTSSDVLIGMDGDFNVGRWLGTGAALLNQRMCCIRTPSPELTKLLEYALPQPLRVINDLTYATTVKHLSSSQIEKIRVALALDRDELRAIVRFLDRETAKIDALVAEQEKLIGLLQEKRQAVISHAVTKGLDPNVLMKDSGVEWLGEVPAHWEVRALKNIVSTPITDGPHETPQFFDEGIPFVSAEAVSQGFINFEKIRGHISAEDHQRYSQKYLPRRGDVYMVKSGATTGVTAIVETDQEFNIWSPLAALRCGDKMLPKYLLHYMRSRHFQEAVTLNWSFGTQQNIGMGVIGDLYTPAPPLEEQTAIASLLDQETAKLDTLMTEARIAITLLQERRTALISAAVTGQIDVRGLVGNAHAPDSIAASAYPASA